MQKQQITIYGYGYVGKAVVNFLKDHYQLQVIDPILPEKPLENIDFYTNREAGDKTKYAIICVPTKMNEDGTCDTSIVEEILKNTDHDFYLIKSTIVPGTTKRLAEQTCKKIAFSPEYIGEGKYEIPFWKDMPHPTNMKLHSFHIFGGPREVTGEFLNLWQKVAGWSATYAQTDSTTAELVKYMENSFLATKKILCDEFYQISKVFGVDYNEAKELWLLDGRVGRAMTLIFPDKRGFGGKCLPKDVNAIVQASAHAGYNPEFLKQVLASNQKFQTLNMSEELKDEGQVSGTPETPAEGSENAEQKPEGEETVAGGETGDSENTGEEEQAE